MQFSSPPNQQAYYEQVWNLVRQIPRGKVASYGQIALMIPPPMGVDFDSYKAFSPRWVGVTGEDQPASRRSRKTT